MNKTQNFGMALPDLSNNADINVLNENFNNIDKGLAPFFISTKSGENVYKVDTGLNKTSLENGYCIRVVIPENSTGEVNILIDTLKIPVKKSGGGSVSNFKANSVYSLTYYNSVFILTSSGGGDDVNFTSNKLLEGYTANNSDGEKVTGTMKNNNQIWSKINAGDSVMIPEGYHNGLGMVTANSLASQTSGNATSEQILQGYSAWANGEKIDGNIVDRGAITTSLNADQVYTIPQGYHSGQGRVIANSLSSQTSGNATSAQILQGYSAWANGEKIDGQISVKGTETYTPSTLNQYISEGQYLNGTQTILGDKNLISENIREGVSIFGVNGNVTIESLGGKRCVIGEEAKLTESHSFTKDNGTEQDWYCIRVKINFVPKYVMCFAKDQNPSTTTFFEGSSYVYINDVTSSYEIMTYKYPLSKNSFMITNTEVVIPVANTSGNPYCYIVTG